MQQQDMVATDVQALFDKLMNIYDTKKNNSEEKKLFKSFEGETTNNRKFCTKRSTKKIILFYPMNFY